MFTVVIALAFLVDHDVIFSSLLEILLEPEESSPVPLPIYDWKEGGR